ncbi:uncharacterized protein [Nicotiana sylvestris]|uniref:uncharacterized protein n=1 Tax=Nicotiana sylvestris TaxID=4096 RepID=UPI00388C351F
MMLGKTKISVHLELQVKDEIIKTLFEYKDVFAWSYDDMLGLSTDLVVHKLPTDPTFPPVKQKLRKDLRKFFQRLRRYNLKLNPAKCAFGVPSRKLLGFLVSRCGIELDPSKIKAIQELPPPKNETEVMSLLGRLNYISRVIAQLKKTCEPIFKLLKKNVVVKWIDECQEAFDKIKRYLSNPPMLVPPEPGRLLILYLTVLDNSFGCVLGQYDVTGKKEQAIYYLTMKAQALADHLAENPVDDEYEPLKTYFPDKEVMCVDKVDHDEKTGWKLFFDGAANMKGVRIWVVLISEIGKHYPVIAQLRFYCTNNMSEYEACILGLRLAIYIGIQEILVLGDLDLLVHQIQGECETRYLKLIPYRQCMHDLCQRLRSVELRHIPRIHNEIVDALATLASMLHHPEKAYVDPVHIQVHDQHVYCNVVEEEIDGKPWFNDIKEYIRSGVYLVHATGDQKRTIRHLASGFFLSGGILYKRTPDLGLLRYIDAKEASTIMTEVHSGVYGSHMSEYVLAKKILRAGLLLAHHGTELYQFCSQVSSMLGATPYLLVYGTETVIPVEVEIPSLRIIVEAEIDDNERVKTRLEQLSLIDEKKLVAVCHGQLYWKRIARAYNKKEIDGKPWFHDIKEYIRSGVYLVHATSDQKRTIRRLASGFFLSGGILYKRTPDLGLLRYIDAKEASTIMTEVHSRVYGSHMSGYVLAKKILRAGLLLAHHGTGLYQFCSQVSSMLGATPYLLVYGTETVIPVEVEIPSLRIIVEAEIDDNERVKTRLEQLSLIDEKKLVAVCHGQLYRKRMARAYNKKRTTVRTSIGATPYLLVYGTETVIPVEVEIPSLRIIVEAEIDDNERVKTRLEQLSLIDEKKLVAVCHGQLYRKRMARAYNKKGSPMEKHGLGSKKFCSESSKMRA